LKLTLHAVQKINYSSYFSHYVSVQATSRWSSWRWTLWAIFRQEHISRVVLLMN